MMQMCSSETGKPFKGRQTLIEQYERFGINWRFPSYKLTAFAYKPQQSAYVDITILNVCGSCVHWQPENDLRVSESSLNHMNIW